MSLPTLVVLIFVVVGLGIAGFGARSVIHARASASWPHVSGKITHSEIDRSSGSDGTSYAPKVRYSYSVNGQPFSADRICFGIEKMSAGYGFAQAYTKRYQAGSTVDVYYDPIQPASAILEPGVSRRTFIPMAFGLGFAFMGAWFGFMFWLFQP